MRRKKLRRVPLDELLGAVVIVLHPCDACGYSKVDGHPITWARFRIATKAGVLYLCGHHFHKHRLHIFTRAYVAEDVSNS